jgi:drug/metabolite transporter (DMT)-like permease
VAAVPRWRGRLAAIPKPIAASCLAAGAAGTGAMTNALVRVATDLGQHPLEVVFFRNLFGFLAMLPVLAGFGILRIPYFRRGRLLAVSSICNLVSVSSLFSALALLPIAEVAALAFTKPLFATIGAALILRELVGPRRWGATIVGFVGVLIVIRPGVEVVHPAAGFVLLSAIAATGVSLSVKRLAAENPATTIVFWQSMLVTLMAFVPMLLVWRTPDIATLLVMAATGALGTTSWLLFTRAMALADASALQPFDFVKLPASALYGYLLFGQVPGPWVWVGASVIFGAAIYIAHREARAGRAVAVPRIE